MPRQPKPLTETQVKQAKLKEKQYVLYDGGGLYLLITSTAKLWRFRYTFEEKQKLMSFGKYPAVGLADARGKREQAKALLAKGIDPAKEKNTNDTSFKAVAERWHNTSRSKWTERYSTDTKRRLESYVYPTIGHMDIATIEPPVILATLRRIENRGNVQTAHIIMTICFMVFRFAVGEGLCQRNPAADLRGLLKTTNTKHNAAIIEPKEFGGLLRAIDSYGGHFETRCALKLMPMVFVRTNELLGAQWTEINFDEALWIIPASRMKMKKDHIVPLSKQALAILSEMKEVSGDNKFIFPSIHNRRTKTLSHYTLLSALRGLGYTPELVTIHGFRSSARTLLDEVLRERYDLIETQLAHKVHDANGRAYNRTEHLEERRRMMQRWTDYLDTLKNGAVIIPFKQAN